MILLLCIIYSVYKVGKMRAGFGQFSEAIPASLKASSKEVKRSLLTPLPFVRNIFFGTQS